MAWDNELPRIVRYLINDVTEPFTFSLSRLQETILVSAQLLLDDIRFINTYTIDVDELSLSPDPTAGDKDNAFINLVCLKTACLIAHNVFKVQALKAGVRVKDGPTEIDTNGILKGFSESMKKACADFEQAKFEYESGNATPGRIILSPFSSPTINFRNSSTYDHRNMDR